MQLTIAINFVSPKEPDKKSEMLSKSDIIEILIYDKSR